MSLWSKSFWVSTAERVITTFAFSAGGMIGTSALHELDFAVIASASGAAALASLLKAVASLGANGTASITGSEVPSGAVVERQVGMAVVAGPANDRVKPNETVRRKPSRSLDSDQSQLDKLDKPGE